VLLSRARRQHDPVVTLQVLLDLHPVSIEHAHDEPHCLGSRGRSARIITQRSLPLGSLAVRQASPAEEPEEPDLAWLSRHSWAWNPARLDALIAGAAPATLYICGGAVNELELADRFTPVFLLEIEGPRLYGGPMASVKQIQVTFDCAEPERVARFWCEVLGYVVPPPPEGFATWDDFDRALPPEHQGSAFACIDPSGAGPRLFFQRVPEGKVVKNRLHLDVRVGTGLVGEERLAALEAECARLVALGAERVRLLLADGYNESCLVMQDIEGNEFCLD
jgi:hypothetical protein